ncbi:MAG TPA: signal peptidase I [Candidatus Avamphibacillus sp.]|nr:signal peptidase I [Candidatus Avamphibacillus sp.]
MRNKSSKGRTNSIISWIGFVLILVTLFLVFRYVITITIISGESMSPTLHDNDIILTNNLFFTPEKNDIILYRDSNGFDVIKRIIAMPNDEVEIKDGVVIVNGEPIEENYTNGESSDMPQITVAENTYFVMGDNRTPGASLDSRNSDIGPIDKEKVKGKLLVRLYPF